MGKAHLGLSDCHKGQNGEGEGAVRAPGMKASFVWEIQEQLLEGQLSAICPHDRFRFRYSSFLISFLQPACLSNTESPNMVISTKLPLKGTHAFGNLKILLR